MNVRREHIDLMELRPNNWMINRDKLDIIRDVWRHQQQDQLPPILVTTIDGELSLIDGHSRAYAALENGQTTIDAELCDLDHIEGSAALYQHIHRTGPLLGIVTIADLSDRIVEPSEHERLWIGYCNQWLEENE